MDKIIYIRNNNTECGVREAKEIEFQIAEDLDCHEFKIICMRLAAALGYHPSNIREVFGREELSQSQVDVRQLLCDSK